jgi:hypothetical protein
MTLLPIEPENLRSRLRQGIISFAFKKLDGTLRTAVGTTNLSAIPVENHPTGSRASSSTVVTFFDIEKRQWRSLSARTEVFSI